MEFLRSEPSLSVPPLRVGHCLGLVLVGTSKVTDVQAVQLVPGMSLQIPEGGLVLSIGDDRKARGACSTYLLRLDIWTSWLEIGCTHASGAVDVTAKLAPGLRN